MWRGLVNGLLEDVDRMEKRNGRDLQGQRPSGTKLQCLVYRPLSK